MRGDIDLEMKNYLSTLKLYGSKRAVAYSNLLAQYGLNELKFSCLVKFTVESTFSDCIKIVAFYNSTMVFVEYNLMLESFDSYSISMRDSVCSEYQ